MALSAPRQEVVDLVSFIAESLQQDRRIRLRPALSPSCPLFALTLASFACICWTTQLGFHVSAIVTSGTDLERVDIIMQQITEGLKVAYGLEVLIVTAVSSEPLVQSGKRYMLIQHIYLKTVAALVAEVARRASSDLPTAGQ